MSHNALNVVSGLAFATKKLVNLLNHQTFDFVFTHHPALLYFLFASSIIPDEIQLQLVSIEQLFYLILLTNFILILLLFY